MSLCVLRGMTQVEEAKPPAASSSHSAQSPSTDKKRRRHSFCDHTGLDPAVMKLIGSFSVCRCQEGNKMCRN